MLKIARAVLPLVLVALSLEAHAGWEKISSKDFALATPPNLAQSQNEVTDLLKLQSSRTDAECKLGQKQANPSFSSLFGDSSLLTKQELKVISPFMSRVSSLGERIADYFKAQYHRTRPYDFDPRIKPCVALPGGAKSYPSSHATVSALDACILAMIFPSDSQNFAELGAQLGHRRMVIGVHFPSDVEAGQALARDICKRLNQEDDFRVELKKVRDAL